MINKNCEEYNCAVEFSYEPNPNFPDKRKYCDFHSAARKASYNAKQNAPSNPTPPVPATENEIVPETGTSQSTVWNHSVAANSYEVGKVGNRHKIYWETIEELVGKLSMLEDAGLLDREEFKPEHLPQN
ncbi:hypothetical protein LCGC14_2700590 [marine sediment metagenome]|uniref:Uncharacterized protein n=1 Tax=marine sediment metagenome TaxID=412755 RepID=A0A0F8ZFY0_9ZZZZ